MLRGVHERSDDHEPPLSEVGAERAELSLPVNAGYLANGSLSAGASALAVARGERVKLRIINASSATTHRVGLDGHQLAVTHADGQAVRPVAVDTVVIGMGERYDVVVQAMNPGVWPLLAGPVDAVVPGVVVPFAYAGSEERLRPVTVWPVTISITWNWAWRG